MTDATESGATRSVVTTVPSVAPNLSAPLSAQLQHRVSSSLLADQVFEALRGWIAQGEWLPGKQLRIREVAALVGTSDMPVREAFRRLEQAGLIVVEPYRGAKVRELSIDELEHVYDIRILLEPVAARAGVEHSDAGVLEAMNRHWQLLQEASERGDVVEAVRQDEQLLMALYTAGPNDVLLKMVRELWDTCRAYKSLWVVNAVEHGLATWSHITHLIDAVERGDGDGAHDILERTYRDARATVRQLLDTQSGRNL
ncbi:GntR family transcriptional regulator [Rhodococcus sp. NPDC056960]|uniref:GntR family transcriptional regulator n=1 Tax=Rhodococcus sp. NPDC056960 TaxID=3345982 RepID=UPI0036432E20